ncbi:CRISPR-associated protein CasA/Cse1 [compost metagenome]
MLLLNEEGHVRWLRFAAGIALGDDPNAPDPMASYRAGSNGLVRLSFTEGRAFWRDLPVLVPDAEGRFSQQAAVLGHAANLHAQSFQRTEQPLLVAGLASDQAKLLRWRAERIALPTALLADPALAQDLRELVGKAEELFGEIRKIATGMLAETLPDPSSKDTRARARSLFDAGPVTALFFSTAERALGRTMLALVEDSYEQAEAHWKQALLLAAEAAWDVLCDGLGRSPAALRTEAKAYPRFRARLREWQPTPNPLPDAKEAQP